jgi:hypothetical protein
MAPPTNKPPPLPVAADHAALQNRISLALASQSSILKSMNLPPRTSSAGGRTHSAQVKKSAHEEEDDFSYQPPNQGLGYKPTGKEEQLSTVDKNLRGRLLGKRGKEAANGAWKAENEDEDEDEGRTGLGRKKRKRDRSADVGADAAREDRSCQELPPVVSVSADVSSPKGEQARGYEHGDVDPADAMQVSPSKEPSQSSSGKHQRKTPRSGAQRRQKRKKSTNGDT